MLTVYTVFSAGIILRTGTLRPVGIKGRPDEISEWGACVSGSVPSHLYQVMGVCLSAREPEWFGFRERYEMPRREPWESQSPNGAIAMVAATPKLADRLHMALSICRNFLQEN